MPSEIFEKILARKIETFKSVFLEDSEGIFKIDGKLFHAQEFGTYRERVLIEIIKSVIPERIQVKDGFVITSENRGSTQCDVILYDSDNTPVINDGVLRFFPIESVLAIGEVKSVIRSKAELKEILEKLAAQKKLDQDISSFRAEGEIITTFLVCKKIDFEFTIDFNDLYENVENKFRHNFILSLEDGLIAYSIEREYFSDANKEAFDHVFKGVSKMCEYPVVRGDLMPSVIVKSSVTEPNIHIKMFLHAIGSTLEHVRKPRIELQNYYSKGE
ncbi:DUF6602 domain-containing protein [Flavobacterium caeni]|uniref:DUF6602 domain-containing protein n=1 Tax=Flavobacterium caeni TaxID=490189 RepID=A0A1G5KHX1_9FLAO|nr:DUF6602 domain-containing protein [Flavobacterium caeni]SCZ00213.1 hypothetical protein SAMN02927903_03321 [Flavobacterium caeni]